MAGQQINLYLKLGVKPAGYPHLQLGALALVLVLLGLGGYAGYLAYSAATLTSEALAMTRQNQAGQAQVAVLDAVQAAEAERLAQVLSGLQAQQREKDQLVTLLATASQGEGRGFSAMLVGLARQHQAGIVLTHIEAADQGASFGLAGTVNEASLVPVYLGRLGQEPAFAGRTFDKVTLKAQGKVTAFEVQSSAPSGAGS
jgi:MSHA biogenesis protein MshI